MSNPRMSIVVTTINTPALLLDFAENFETYGHLENVDVIIIGDRKTPVQSVRDLERELNLRGLSTRFLDIEEQEAYLADFPELRPLIPYDSDNRRNIGYLLAAERGSEILVALDDDNHAKPDVDWYAGHALVGTRVVCTEVDCSNGWFNPCGMMDYDADRVVFARGYPYAKRRSPGVETYGEGDGRVVMNGGLWLDDPDVDSLTRLTDPIRAVRVNEDRLMLAKHVFAPINTQNTAFHRDVIPAFYFVPVGDCIGGVPVERYGDIWAGFFAAKVVHHLDDRITFGAPACDHRRNAHNLLNDLELEFWSIRLTDPLAEKLVEWKLTATNYVDCYKEIADHLEAADWPHKRMAGEFKAFFGKMAHAMRVWAETCRRIGLDQPTVSAQAHSGS